MTSFAEMYQKQFDSLSKEIFEFLPFEEKIYEDSNKVLHFSSGYCSAARSEASEEEIEGSLEMLLERGCECCGYLSILSFKRHFGSDTFYMVHEMMKVASELDKAYRKLSKLKLSSFSQCARFLNNLENSLLEQRMADASPQNKLWREKIASTLASKKSEAIEKLKTSFASDYQRNILSPLVKVHVPESSKTAAGAAKKFKEDQLSILMSEKQPVIVHIKAQRGYRTSSAGAAGIVYGNSSYQEQVLLMPKNVATYFIEKEKSKFVELPLAFSQEECVRIFETVAVLFNPSGEESDPYGSLEECLKAALNV